MKKESTIARKLKDAEELSYKCSRGKFNLHKHGLTFEHRRYAKMTNQTKPHELAYEHIPEILGRRLRAM